MDNYVVLMHVIILKLLSNIVKPGLSVYIVTYLGTFEQYYVQTLVILPIINPCYRILQTAGGIELLGLFDEWGKYCSALLPLELAALPRRFMARRLH